LEIASCGASGSDDGAKVDFRRQEVDTTGAESEDVEIESAAEDSNKNVAETETLQTGPCEVHEKPGTKLHLQPSLKVEVIYRGILYVLS
jgi:hypothetical protein